MSNDNWFGIEPPMDANGKVIPFDTETLYSTNGQVFHVNNIKYVTKKKRWETYGYFERDFGFWEGCTNDLLLASHDSWEKLEEDAKKANVCDYAHAPRDEYGITVCRDCRFQKSKSCRQEMFLDMIARAKKLAGVEEQEGDA